MAAAAAMTVLSGCAVDGVSAAPLTPGQVFEAALPGVVIVETNNAVTWSAPQPTLTSQKSQQLRSAVVAMVRAGQVANNQTAIGQASVNLLVSNPGNWFSAGSQRHQQTDSVLQLGSGFFVTEDGYLLTNDHVVQISTADVQQQLLDDLQRQSGDAQEVATFRDETSHSLGVPFTDGQAGKLFQWMVGVFKSDLRVESVTPSYRIGLGTMSPSAIQSQGLPVQLVAHGQSTPGKDVALLKAAGGPFVSLATETSLPVRGAPLTVIGYPCQCAAGVSFDAAQALRPVLTSGSAKEQVVMSGGWNALGTDAPIEHGNSGGPVLGDDGRVVGLATFTDAAATGAPRSFAVPMSVAAAIADQAHVRLEQGPLGQRYARAVGEYQQAHYQAALPLFQQVASSSRHDPYAQQYVARTQRAIAEGRDQTPPLSGALPVVAVGVYVAVSVVAVVLGVLVFRWRRRRRRAW